MRPRHRGKFISRFEKCHIDWLREQERNAAPSSDHIAAALLRQPAFGDSPAQVDEVAAYAEHRKQFFNADGTPKHRAQPVSSASPAAQIPDPATPFEPPAPLPEPPRRLTDTELAKEAPLPWFCRTWNQFKTTAEYLPSAVTWGVMAALFIIAVWQTFQLVFPVTERARRWVQTGVPVRDHILTPP